MFHMIEKQRKEFTKKSFLQCAINPLKTKISINCFVGMNSQQ